MTVIADASWWHGAVIYQVYPRSYRDMDGDGVGDLRGITAQMDYIAGLGVDAVWISPFFLSPMKDFGYDVADYCAVDPLFGTMADFDALLAAAHARGIKIIIDMVLSHTSDRHDWFTESRSSRDNAKADWYVWADPKPDGSPPNNWQSVFGGPSWEYDVRRGQYYLHNFLVSQPDLNLHNPAVKDALFDACRFWLDKGVDGFRLDAMSHFFHDPALPDNPANPAPKPGFFNIDFPVPFTMQLHEHDALRAPVVKFAEEMRAMLDEYPDRMAVAEIGGEDGIAFAAQLTDGPQRLHTAYNFSLISGTKPSAGYIRRALENEAQQKKDSWPSWAFSNHDVVRVASRWGGQEAENNPAFARVVMAMLCSLRGSVFIYQGEELGLPDAPITYEQIQDPWGRVLYPLWQGRDGCRTPMPWDSTKKQAGFSDADTTWLPIPDNHREKSVAAQERDPQSPLQFTRQLLAWRAQHKAMRHGTIHFIDHAEDSVMLFSRKEGEEEILCAFNLGPAAQTLELPEGEWHTAAQTPVPAIQAGERQDGRLALPAYGFCYLSSRGSR